MNSNEQRIEIVSDIDNLLAGLRRTFLPAAVVSEAAGRKKHREVQPISNLTLVQLNKVRFRERKDIHYAMTSLFSALHGTNRSIVFILSGNKEKTTIHLGFWNETDGEKGAEELFAAIKGFIPGTEYSHVLDSAPILDNIESYTHINAMVGVPSEKQAFQDEKRTAPIECGIERLADAMTSDNYALIITATPVHTEESALYFENISSILDYAHRLVKMSEQRSFGTQQGTSVQEGANYGGSSQKGCQESSGETLTETPWCLKRWSKGIARFVAGGAAPQKQISKQIGAQFTEGLQWGVTINQGVTSGFSKSEALTYEHVNHQAIFAEELLKMIQGRLKNGIGEGLWKTNVLFLSDREESAVKGCNILKGMWSGAQSHQDPIRFIKLTELIKGDSGNRIDNALALMSNKIVEDHPLGIAYSGGYTWMTSGELALEANLPYYELPSLSSENVVEYGRFLPTYDPHNQIMLGNLVDRNIKTDTPVWMDTFRLNRHLFITGLTGAGKSNTVRSILLELARLGIPFLVIETVKSEYRLLRKELERRYKEGTSKFSHLDIFSLSGYGAEKLVLNPFAFEIRAGEEPATALISHIDRLKAVFNSSLGMYSSMPYILEEMIYKAYKNAGWNLETGKNVYFEKARKYLGLDENAEMRNYFLPTLSDLAGLVDEAIKSFFPDKSDYGISLVGALKSRLNSLSRGAKGLLLNQRLSLPMQALLERPCVIELEAFADNDEKAFIMALLLSRIYEFRSGKLAKELKHVLVIEEAHRLLANPPQTGEYSANSRGKSVEVFSDMLAEIRAYGQGIVIADQIPGKLIPDVIKNTDIKIVHRLMAKEDREAVGTAMNLADSQINDLNRATPGLATVSFDGLNSAIRVQIRNVPLQITCKEDNSAILRIEAMTEYKRNVFLPPSEHIKESVVPDQELKRSYWLILRLFFIAAFCENGVNPLLSFRLEVESKKAINNYQPKIGKDNLWACIAEGAHLLLNDLVANGMSPGDAGVLISALVAFARPWSKDKAFRKGMNLFIRLAKKEIDFRDRTTSAQIDFFSFVLQMYADRTDFQTMVKEALLVSSIADWTPLQNTLLEYVKDLTENTLESDIVAKILLMLRLIRCIKGVDDVLAKKAGLAYHTLIQLLPGQNTTVITQKWEDENND